MDLRDYQQSANDFDHLSLKDILEARDQYHVHLMRHPNVVATAVGRYRIRKGDAWLTPHGTGKHKGTGERTLANSEVRPYSWPCVLVFVEHWVDAAQFAKGGHYDPDQMVPKTLYLPDGRRVPVCVVLAPRELTTDVEAPEITYPLNNIGGGYPVISRTQGGDHVATIACLVTDGHKVYALTNRHVTGEVGESLYSKLNGKELLTGVTASSQCDRLAFAEVYDGWEGKKIFVNIDAGLIDIDNLDVWTAQVRDIGTIGPLADLAVDNLSLALIGCHVRGRGSASGLMLGEIQGLFYRYMSMGGFEFVADFLIGPRSTPEFNAKTTRPNHLPPPFATHPGDSGTLWLLEPFDRKQPAKRNQESKKKLPFLPLAMQWGAHVLETPGGPQPQSYALATLLSTVCRQLGVVPVRDWNLDQTDTWGAVGHFSIATRTIDRLSNAFPQLVALMKNNLKIISHDDNTILNSEFKGMGSDAFVPMADVPDFFWKHGKQGASRFYEGPNHFADMDHFSETLGYDLLTLCADPTKIDANVWDGFYDSVTEILTGEPIQQKYRGLLPFRVWQIFDEMIAFVKSGDRPRFVCAAGVLAHYLGDACQPLHISFLHDGDPRQPIERTVHHRDGTVENVKDPLGKGVHAAYEDEMVNSRRDKILDGLEKTPKPTAAERVANGFEAAQLTVQLMRDTIARIPPQSIVDAYVQQKGKTGRAAAFWKQFGTATIRCMQDGTHLMALLWESAWDAGKGNQSIKSSKALTKKEAMKICADHDFLPSLPINQIGAVLERPAS